MSATDHRITIRDKWVFGAGITVGILLAIVAVLCGD